MFRTSISARHRATPIHSIVLAGLAYTAKTNAVNVGKPAMIVAATGGLVLASGAAAQAGTYIDTTAAAPAPAPVTAAPAAAAGTHTVVAGDTLGAISARYGVALNTVLAQNNLSYASVIYPGQQIKVSGSAFVAAPAAVSPAVVPAAAPATQVSFTVPAPAAAPAQSGISFASSTITPVATSAPAASGVNAAILASAYAQLGAIQDCTVLGEQALKAAGISGVGDESPAGLMEFATPVSNPQPGDFIYYADGGAGVPHNAIYIGDGKAIHSGFNGNQTVINSADIGSGPSYYRVNG
ncbi:LysM repeat protein [Arthrobacter sp. CAN_A6]|uniref:LysM peptidoglycan-binding domain-containing protein n=1 Tax=Arthrobacter sp. CAN_A6 TaxID=2787721 RepID=UPI0018C8DBD0